MLTERIAAIHARSRQTYGAPRVHAELHICGARHGRKRVARLVRSAAFAGRIPQRYRRTTIGDRFMVLPAPSACWRSVRSYAREFAR